MSPLPINTNKRLVVIAVVLAILLVMTTITFFIVFLFPHGRIPAEGNGEDMLQRIEGYDTTVTAESPAAQPFWSRVTYRVESADYGSDDTGSAEVVVTVPDMTGIMRETLDWLVSQDHTGSSEAELRAEVVDRVTDALEASTETVSTTVRMDVVKTQDEWKLVPNDEWQEAIIGGADQVFDTYYQQYIDSVIGS